MEKAPAGRGELRPKTKGPGKWKKWKKAPGGKPRGEFDSPQDFLFPPGAFKHHTTRKHKGNTIELSDEEKNEKVLFCTTYKEIQRKKRRKSKNEKRKKKKKEENQIV